MFNFDLDNVRAQLSRHALVFVLFASVLLHAAPGLATTEFNAAGVLPVARENGSTYVLLGRSWFRPWFEMLAGGREAAPGDAGQSTPRRETAYETAVRESFEESRGFLKPDYLRNVTDPGKFLRDGSFVFFGAEIDKFSIDEIKREPIPEVANRAPFLELIDFAWVPVEAILLSNDVFVIDDNGRRIQVRPQLKPRLLQAQAAGWL